jgi:hypothetical protein
MRAPAKAAALAPSVTAPPSPKANHEEVEAQNPPAEIQAVAEAFGSKVCIPRKPGRPSKEDRARTLTATKPWEAEGISQRTWYRKKRT